jgi:hypothetical protein
MAQLTAAEIAQLIGKTPLFRAEDRCQSASKNRSKMTFLGDLDPHRGHFKAMILQGNV